MTTLGEKPFGITVIIGGFFVNFFRRRSEADFHNYFQEGGILHEGTEFMPMSCWSVLNTDLVKNDTGPECMSWCAKHIGEVPRPICGLVPTYGTVFRVCMKVQSWSFYEWLFQLLPFGTYYNCWLVACAYGCLSIGIGFFHSTDNTTKQTRPPRRDGCEEDGPFAGRTAWYCCRRAPSDYQASKREMLYSMCLALPDPFLDINGLLVFFSNGQPFYAIAFLLAIFLPSIHDPLQTNSFSHRINAAGVFKGSTSGRSDQELLRQM